MNESKSEEPKIPAAVVRSPEQVANARLTTRLWWLTGACVLLAIALTVTSFQSQGTPITIHFQDGHGLKAGDTLRYRGIDVGDVSAVAIAPDLTGVNVEVLLAPGNERIAVEGSQFWIERPRLRLGQVSGLDTVLGAKYLGVIPGDVDAATAKHFEGLDSPLNIASADSTEIRIQFPAGEGLAVGDMARYRGIAVGEVTEIELSEDVHSVWVRIRLVGAAQKLARAGTQFWIERPRIDLTEVRGLDTLVSGRYIAMETHSEDAPEQFDFVGLAEPPPLPRRDGSLEVELDAPDRMGMVRGGPINYRGLEVGRIANVGLSSDGATVKVTAVIDAEYAELVRANSKWWTIGGLKMDANLRGVHVEIDSLSAWLRGGIAFATPEEPGKHVVTGHRFVLEGEPLPEWLEWEPRIAVGHRQAFGQELPRPLRVVASWKANLLGLYRRRTAETWGIAMDNDKLYVPLPFIENADEADTEITLEYAGKSAQFDAALAEIEGSVAAVPYSNKTHLFSWQSAKVSQRWNDGMLLLVVNPELTEPLPLDGTRLTAAEEGGGLRIAPGVPIVKTLEGSPVVDANSGDVKGLLVAHEDGWHIAPIIIRE